MSVPIVGMFAIIAVPYLLFRGGLKRLNSHCKKCHHAETREARPTQKHFLFIIGPVFVLFAQIWRWIFLGWWRLGQLVGSRWRV